MGNRLYSLHRMLKRAKRYRLMDVPPEGSLVVRYARSELVTLFFALSVLGGCSTQIEQMEDEYEGLVTSSADDDSLCMQARRIADAYMSKANSEGVQRWIAIADQKCAPKVATISGELSYPSDYLPDDMKVCARNVETREDHCETTGGEPSYSMELEQGTYIVWAETQQFPNGRAFFSKSVVCGLSVECTDHRPIEVKLDPGSKILRVDPQDWYARN